METIVEIVRIRQEVKETPFKKALISPDVVYEVAKNTIGDEDREIFLVICLNTQNFITAIHKTSVGSLNMALAHPREIFKSAILNNSASIILAHNHPSGVLKPSIEDREVTKRMIQAGEILGIQVLDHLIITPDSYYSFRQHEGYLFS